MVALVLLVPITGCLEADRGEGGTEVTVSTTHDPTLTREEQRGKVPGAGAAASDGNLNIFLFSPGDFEEMDGQWGLWDPVAPPEREPGDLLQFPGNASGMFPLDGDGRTSFRVQAPGGTVLGFWVWGSAEADGAAGCQDRFFYTSPDPPPATLTVGNDAEVHVEVPFGMGCTDA